MKFGVFPHKKYRPYQREFIERTGESFNDGKKLVIGEGPTGTGKSASNLTVAGGFESAYYICTQKVLQDQLMKYKGMGLGVIKGRANYKCNTYKNMNCENAPCTLTHEKHNCEDCGYKEDCDVEDVHIRCVVDCDNYCDYEVAKKDAMGSKVCVMNSAYAFLAGDIGFPKRGLLIVDEAHNISRLAMDTVSVTVYKNMFDKFVEDFKSVEEYALFFKNEVLPEIVDYIIKNKRKYFDTKERKYLNNVKSAKRLEKKLNFLIRDVGRGHKWVVDRKKRKVKFQPVTIGRFLRNKLWKLGDSVLVTSGTIVDPVMFMKEGGLNIYRGATSYVKVPMHFPVRNRPIYFIPCGKMSKKYKYDTIPKMVNIIGGLYKKYEGENMIIHAHSYENANLLYKLLAKKVGEEVILLQDVSNREESLNRWTESDSIPIFISVNMREGISLDDDLARVNVISKVPFVYLGDKRVKERMKMEDGRKWYYYNVIVDMAQAYGRCVRSETDWAHTYILDSDFGFIYNVSKRGNMPSFPKWFEEAINWRVRGI